MQIDSSFIDAGIAVTTSLASSAIAYGILKTKVERLERDIQGHEENFISRELFNEIVTQLRADFHEMRSDVKQVLHLMSKHTKLSENDSD